MSSSGALALDTNVVVDLLRSNAAVRRNYDDALEAGASLTISTIVFQELLFGVARHPQPQKERARLLPLLRDFAIVAFEAPDAETGGRARAEMERQGRRAPAGDFIVGAHALARGVTLVTANTRHFENIPGLQLLDWRLLPKEQETHDV